MSASRRHMSQPNTDLADRVRSILAGKGLTLSQTSQRLETTYGRSSPYFVPHNFYYDLRAGSFSPSIQQIIALSRITEYRLADWLRVFGVEIENIARFQVALPSRRTMLLDSSLVDPYAWVPWFENRGSDLPAPPVAPLGQLLRSSGMKQIRSLLNNNTTRFLYAKIGYQDALAYPDLVPGSIVRVNPDTSNDIAPRASRASSQFFLIEHSKGLFCCRLRAIGEDAFVPVSTKLSYGQIELRHPQETRLVGVVDLELRPSLRFDPPEVPDELARQWKPRPLSGNVRVGALLRNTRITLGISLREASAVSRRIVEILHDDAYFISPSSLCDYELLNSAPRRFQTAITLCSVYGLALQTLLKAMGIDPEQVGTEPMPDRLLSRSAHAESEKAGTTIKQGGFLEQLLERCEEVPFFLRRSIEALAGVGGVSLDDFFWIGGKQDVPHPYLANGLLAIVNRRRRRPCISHPSHCASNRCTCFSSVTARICVHVVALRTGHWSSIPTPRTSIMPTCSVTAKMSKSLGKLSPSQGNWSRVSRFRTW